MLMRCADVAANEEVVGSVELYADPAVEQWVGYRSRGYVACDLKTAYSG